MGILSKIKRQARKLMPKELSGIAQLAAPFVGANNALLGAGLSFLGQARAGEGKINPFKVAMSGAPGLRFQGGKGLGQFKITGYKGESGYGKNSLRDLFLRGERSMVGETDAETFIDDLIQKAEKGDVEALNNPLYKLAVEKKYDGTTRFSDSLMSEGTDPIFGKTGKKIDKFLYGGFDQTTKKGRKKIGETSIEKTLDDGSKQITTTPNFKDYEKIVRTPKAGILAAKGADFSLAGLKDSALVNSILRQDSPFDVGNPISALKLGSAGLSIYSFIDANKQIKTAEEAAAAVEAQMIADGETNAGIIEAAKERAAAIFDQLTKADFNLANGGRIGFARGTPEDGIGSLNSGAESIMYEGTDGARSPEQTENEQENLQAMGLPRGLSLEDAVKTFEMSIGREPKDLGEVLEFFKNRKLSEGPVLPEDPTKPINPFGPRPQKEGIAQMAAVGGRMGFMYGSDMGSMGGLSSLQTQPSDVTPPGMELDLRGGGFIPIGKAEKADDVKARVSKNEFVFTADAVKAAGGGSVNEGAKKMYDTMKRLESQVA
jgi:hypothetical protein